MMFPLRNDVTIECDAPDPWKSNSTFCKIVRAVVFVVGVRKFWYFSWVG